MITENIMLTKLTAADGMTLTNGESFGKEIYLGLNDDVANWSEITDAQALALREAVERSLADNRGN